VSIPCRTQVWKPSAYAERVFEKSLVPHNAKWCAERGLKMNEVELMMHCCNQIPFGHKVLADFIICLWQLWWGEHIQIEKRGYVNTWLVRMVRAMTTEKRPNFMGCGAGGKTTVAAAWLYTMWKLKPFCTSCFLSTTSAEAGESRTWGAVKNWHKLDSSSVGKRIESRHIITLDEECRDDDGTKDRDYRNGIKCVNIKPGQEGRNVMASIVGRHNERVLWYYDEMPFMDLGLLDARVNLNTNPFSQCGGLGNAPNEGDPMYIDCTPFGAEWPDGWNSVDKDRHEEWPTKSGRCFYFNGEKSPNYQAPEGEPAPFPRLMNEGFRREVLRDSGGEDTPMYWKQFYGFPPMVDIADKVFTDKLLRVNGCFEEPVWADATQKVLGGLDLGFKLGGDPCVICFGKVGMDHRAKRVLGCEKDGVVLNPSQRDAKDYETQIAMRVIDECRKRGCTDIALDVTGDGGLLLQAIEAEARRQKYVLNVLAVSFSGTAEDRIVVPGEKRRGDQMFKNKVAQLWVVGRICCSNGVVRGMGEYSQVKTQLCARKGSNDDQKRFSVEPKKEMKKRLKRSPDHGDAWALLVHLSEKHGLSGADVGAAAAGARPRSPREALERALGTGGSAYSGHGGMGRYGGR
jgi:hypothetical protein